MHQIKMRLDEWSAYHRIQQEYLGYPKVSSIHRAIKLGPQGAAIRSEYREPSIPEMPPDIKRVDDALLGLYRDHPKAYDVIRQGCLYNRRDKWFARNYRTCQRTIRRWRKYGYEQLEKRLRVDVLI